MSWNPLQIRSLGFFGPDKLVANLEFHQGVNVICGASNTGKSFVVKALDYFLGGSKPLDDIPERVGFDRGRLSVKTADDNYYTLERSTDGGSFNLFDGYYDVKPIDIEARILKQKHDKNKIDNISGWLLSHIDLLDKQVKKNAKGITQSLSFRNLARLVIVDENEIIKNISPFTTGQYVTRTSELSTLKLLLTGVDDSSFISTPKTVKETEGISAKLELIEQWVEDLYEELGESGINREELETQVKKLDKAIETSRENLEVIQHDLTQSVNLRRRLSGQREQIADRVNEIDDLTNRFDLLEQHYSIDIERLMAIQESGSLFIHQEKVKCPLCGALPGDQHSEDDCDGNVEDVVNAAQIEIGKIERLSIELTKTVKDLAEEQSELQNEFSQIDQQYSDVDNKIKESMSPTIGESQASFSRFVDKRSEVKRFLDIFERIDHLENQKAKFLKKTETKGVDKEEQVKVSENVLDKLAEHVENLLKSWNFPEANRVHYDKKSDDFVIDGKPRQSHGKGFRAITHAAVSIGLMEYCKYNDLPHPGFVVLDSPLLSYYGPEGKEDDLKGTDLKQRFYKHLVKHHSDGQVIIIENEHPQKELLDSIHFTDFTKNPNVGRYGFFPNQ